MIEFWSHEYDELVGDIYGDVDDEERAAPGPAERGGVVWNRFDEVMRAKSAQEEDEISDSESVVSVCRLGEEARLDEPGMGMGEEGALARQHRRQSGDENTWEVGRFVSAIDRC